MSFLVGSRIYRVFVYFCLVVRESLVGYVGVFFWVAFLVGYFFFLSSFFFVESSC